MFEKVNPSHPDKIADRIAGHIVDMAYAKQENPKVAVEVLIGHNECKIVIEADNITAETIKGNSPSICDFINRITKEKVDTTFKIYGQDTHLADNQKEKIKCGDNGIFRGVPTTEEQYLLTGIVEDIYYNNVREDGKYVLTNTQYGNTLIACQSYVEDETKFMTRIKEYVKATKGTIDFYNINPIGAWTGGINVDTGATNRKLGSDMGDAITGGGICLSGDSEYLGEDMKWHKMKEYKTSKVAQWNNGKLEFVKPLKYIHNKYDDLIHIYNDTKLSMCLTPYHEVLVKTSKNNLIKRPAYIIAEKLDKGIGHSGFILHNFTYENKVKSEYADENELRLQISFCADGSILNLNKYNGRIRVKKKEKIKRLRELFKGKDYKETKDGEYSIFWYKFAKKSKSLYECCKNEDLRVVYSEIYKWDGSEKEKVFRTTKKEDADFIQFVIMSLGKVATITKDDRVGNTRKQNGKEYRQKSICYAVHELKSTTTALCKNKGSKINVEYSKEKQESYCFEVPSHNLIIRHNDRVFITGNCGKDLSKADVSVNIYCHLIAHTTGQVVEAFCSIGATDVNVKVGDKQTQVPYSQIVALARDYVFNIVGGFEKLAEWGLIR